MELPEFLKQTQEEVRAEMGDRLSKLGDSYPYAESVFTEIVMHHMAEIGMTFEPVVCHYSARFENANLRLSGYAISDESDQIDLFVSLYDGVEQILPVSDAETKKAADQCLRFLLKCAQGHLASAMDQSNDAYALALTIQGCYADLEQIRVYVLTDKKAKAKFFRAREIQNRTVKLEVMDIERLHRHWSEGKPRDELVVNFEEVAGMPLPCIYVPAETADYDYALTVIPGEAVRFLYEKYGERLLEANVRSFLSMTGKVNRGIRDTLNREPQRFIAYNNGIVVVTDEIGFGRTHDGGPSIQWLKGMQIVNGGQTTASIYFTKKANPKIELRYVQVPAKIIILRSEDTDKEEGLISDISKFSNSQNSVRQSDLSANKPFHIEVERLANSTYCPDGIGRWFYERSTGSYKTMLARDGTTVAKLKNLKQAIPPTRKFSKTDLAKFLNSWDQFPDSVSLGAQKNFIRFMDKIEKIEEEKASILVGSVQEYKKMIAKVILFKSTQKIVRPLFSAFQAAVTTYTISLLANRLGDRLDLDKIWMKQDLSPQLKEQIRRWALEVEKILNLTSQGRMISEWAKKPECWIAVRTATYSKANGDIPEFQ